MYLQFTISSDLPPPVGLSHSSAQSSFIGVLGVGICLRSLLRFIGSKFTGCLDNAVHIVRNALAWMSHDMPAENTWRTPYLMRGRTYSSAQSPAAEVAA
ncbi:hypothetical protein FRC12_022161 [Ceratobasidium sp. 428]|nr:hypothetical protein FRC09_018525 [Ceratobasidium sp. 395]KAG8727885.1 hypothetical protein FRC12_022161 [Ceratobasidium sp. 428]